MSSRSSSFLISLADGLTAGVSVPVLALLVEAVVLEVALGEPDRATFVATLPLRDRAWGT